MTSSPSEVGRITLERVTFRYLEQSKRPVLDEVSASFDRSRITVLTGPSGCGKSTLLYLAAGIYPQNAGFLQGGTVRVEGQEPTALGPGERCALVGMLFQNPELQFCMDTVENELFFCLENRRVPRAEMEERLSAALDFCGIAHLRRRPLRSLSGGEKQRAALACLAALRPAWILLDEPFANLDDQTAALLCGQLARLHRECGTGILTIDHRLDHWLSIADEIRLMAQDGTLDGAAYAPSALSPQAWAERGVSVPGCPYQAARPVKTGPEEVVLSLRGLRVSQDGREVLRDVNADFFRGRIGGDIKVFRFGADQQISYGAADNKSFISGVLKLLADGYCKRAHGQEVNSVFFSRNNMSFLPNFCRHIRFEALFFFNQLSYSVRTEAFRTAYVR